MSKAPDQPRVLVIDDDIDAATSLAAMMRAIGCRAAAGFGESTAARLAQLFKPNVVILDLQLQSATGCDVLKQIKRKASVASEAVFVCLTGHASEQAKCRCHEVGFDYFVSKPMHGEQLAAILDDAKGRIAGGRRSGIATERRSRPGRAAH